MGNAEADGGNGLLASVELKMLNQQRFFAVPDTDNQLSKLRYGEFEDQ